MKWERSRNRHGLWDGATRIGYIGVSKRGQGRGRYEWFFDAKNAGGAVDTLAAAKTIIEQMHREVTVEAPSR